MSIANMRDLLRDAAKENRAVAAFSVASIDSIMGVIRAAEALNTPVILQTAQGRLKWSPLHIIGPAMLGAAREARVPVGVHLDHTRSMSVFREALDMGFTSVMFDGSSLPMEENIRLTREVIGLARPYSASVEAEIGVMEKTETGEAQKAVCADPDVGVYFAGKTGVDALAVAIGNAHGIYEGTPQLRFDVLENMQARCDTPFVLHGGSGISDEDFRRCISLGIRKVNIATATFMAVHEAATAAKGYFPMLEDMTDAAEAVARQHISVFGLRKNA